MIIVVNYHAIYILGKYKGKDFGKKLFEAGVEELKRMGYDKMIIGCLVGNPSNVSINTWMDKLIKDQEFLKNTVTRKCLLL